MAMRTFMKSEAVPLRAALAATAALALAAALSGCSTFGVAPFPEPIRPPIEAEGEDTPAPEAQEEEASRYSPTPGVRITRTQARGVADDLGADLEGPPIEAAFNGVPIVAFINEVFGTQLGMSFVISPGLQEKTDLVTLRLTSPVPLRQFFSTARQVMQEYGVTIREQDGVLTFLATQEIEPAKPLACLSTARARAEATASQPTGRLHWFDESSAADQRAHPAGGASLAPFWPGSSECANEGRTHWAGRSPQTNAWPVVGHWPPAAATGRGAPSPQPTQPGKPNAFMGLQPCAAVPKSKRKKRHRLQTDPRPPAIMLAWTTTPSASPCSPCRRWRRTCCASSPRAGSTCWTLAPWSGSAPSTRRRT